MDEPLCGHVVIRRAALPPDPVEQVFYVARQLKHAGVENFDEFFTQAQGLRADEILSLVARWVTLIDEDEPTSARRRQGGGSSHA